MQICAPISVIVAAAVILVSVGIVNAQSVDTALEGAIRASFEREGFDTSDDAMIEALAQAAAENGVTSADFAPLPPMLSDDASLALVSREQQTFNNDITGSVIDKSFMPAAIGISILVVLALLVALWRRMALNFGG